MLVQNADPRGTSWEIGDATYRVCFWSKLSQGNESDSGYAAEEFDVTGASVFEVLDWIASRKESVGRSHTLYVVTRHGSEQGLIRLAGVDPTAAPQ